MGQIRPIALALAAMLAFQWSADAERLALKYGLTQPFYTPALNVQWAAPTNVLPRTVIVFKVVPDEHPEVTTSNLMTIGRFCPSDSVKTLDSDVPLPRGVYAFRTADDGRTLLHAPQRGSIDYSDGTAFHGYSSNAKAEGVPDEAAALELALQLLPRIGISTNDLVKKASGEPRCVFPVGSWGRMDKQSG